MKDEPLDFWPDAVGFEWRITSKDDKVYLQRRQPGRRPHWLDVGELCGYKKLPVWAQDEG